MACIGVDLGDKRCGIALEIEGISFPEAIVSRVSLVLELKKLLAGGKFDTIVVGLPYDLYNKQKKQLQKTKEFILKLENIFPDIKVAGIDERFSSFEADNILRESGKTNNDGQKDAIAASLILESYLKIN